MQKRKLCFDIEATNLLTGDTIDYTASPFKLKPGFLVHCAVVIDIETNECWEFVGHEEINDGLIPLLEEAEAIIGHNIINYDLLALKLVFGLNYTVQPDTINGKPVRILDTLVISKMLNPDRQGHSLEYFGEKLGYEKIDWRQCAIDLGLIKWGDEKGAEFRTYHPDMLVYNTRDVELNIKTYELLMKEWGMWDWSEAFATESAVADIITRQSHRGFAFASEKAVRNVKELDKLMEEARVVVEPLIPAKPPTQAQAKEHTPPKIQLKKPTKKEPQGAISAVMLRWVERMGGQAFEATDDLPAHVRINDKTYRLPMKEESLLKKVPAKIDDTTHIKGWFVELGWVPSAWKERDLTVNTKKQKLTLEKFEETVDRYLEATYNSAFRDYRIDKLKTALRSRWSVRQLVANRNVLREEILAKGLEKPLKVWTNPQITVGQDKEICPNLLELEDKFAHTRSVTSYLTYKHRRNSILGGGFDPDELDEDNEPHKGYLAYVRDDGRISTPADTCGAGTSRFKHRQVANIPRVTSLYGMEMRSLFGVTNDFFQMGYDFDSLEAKIEAHYCLSVAMKMTQAFAAELKLKLGAGDSFTKNKQQLIAAAHKYAESLTAEKPNDIHTVTAAQISVMIGQPFSRGNAKSVKYGCSYGAQAARVQQIVGCDLETAEAIFEAFWEAAKPLAIFKDAITWLWKNKCGKRFVPGIDGRKIPTRSAHALVNSSFQSAGVICAKKAMVIHDRKLKAEGFAVDFFSDNWKEMDYCQQMIAYHDEAQLEVSRKLVAFKMFDNKEDAQAFKDEEFAINGKIWSDIGKSPKGGFFVAYSRPGELAVQAVVEAGEFYKLNVPLSAGYMLGRDWGECH